MPFADGSINKYFLSYSNVVTVKWCIIKIDVLCGMEVSLHAD